MTQEVFRIPVANVPQRFGIDLNGRSFIFVCKYNPEMPNWVLDVLDGDTEESLIACLPLVTGTNLLAQHEYIGVDGAFVVYTDGDGFSIPTLDNLGVESNLYFVIEQ